MTPTSPALLEAILTISSELDPRALLHRIVVAASDLTGARYGGIGVHGPDGFDEFVSRDGDPRGPGLLAVPITIRGTAYATLYLADRADGRPLDSDDEARVRALAEAVVPAIENARNHRLGERRRQWAQAATDLADRLALPIPLEDALRFTAAHARSVSGSDLAAVLQFPPDSHPVIAAVDAARCVDPTDLVRAVAEGAQWVDRELTSLEVHLDEQRILVVPLRAHLTDPGALVVVLEGANRAEARDEREFLAEYADRAALAVDRARAVAQRAEHAALVARQRIARDLNDDVIQRLYATGLQLQGTHGLEDTARRDRAVEETVAALDLTIRGLRSTMRGLG